MKNLVFTSAGDRTDFDNLWLDVEREYDVWVVYYGSNEKTYERYKSKVDYIEKRVGSKFQNFEHIYKTKNLSKYERFFIVDDDIIISTQDINKLFIMSQAHDFWICGPSFDEKSRISHRITKHNPGVLFRYTNYIEVNTPLLTKKALNNLMKMYDSSLIGWGIDHLYIWANGWDEKERFAIIDDVQCTNPKESTKKGGRRELEKVKDWKRRSHMWNTFEKIHNIPKIRRKYYKIVKLSENKKIYRTKPLVPVIVKPKEYKEPLKLETSNKDKIAFMFLTKGNLHQPSLIYEFLKEGKDKCNIYAHTKDVKSIDQDFLLKAQIPEKVETEWGKIGLVKATIALLKEALKDPTNKYFYLLSESCIPLYPFDIVYTKIVSQNNKSWIQKIMTYQTSRQKKYDTLKNPEKIGIHNLDDFHLCSQWMILSRKHAELVVTHDYTNTIFKDAHIPDECYFINVLKHHDKNYNDNVIAEHQVTFRKMTHQHPMSFKKFDYNILVYMRNSSKGVSYFGRKVGDEVELTYNDLKKINSSYIPRSNKKDRIFKKIKTKYGYKFI